MTTNQLARILRIGVILELTLATALIHFSLGGTLFLLNGAGYLVLAAAYAIASLPAAPIRRFGWLPRIGLVGYAAITIGAYLLAGPYFTLGWITKGIELAIVGLVLADLLIAYDGAAGVARAAAASLAPRRSSGAT